MKLRRILLRNFRGVIESEIRFADGVTVIEGPNEAGKSSIADAFRLIRRYKAHSRHREILALKPVDRDAGPEVEVELSTGPYHLTYRKRWVQRPVTELAVHAPRPHSFTGDEAHDRFGEILSETLDLDLLTALDVVQGTSLDQPRLANVLALQRALDEPSSETEGHDVLLERIEEVYSRYFTPTGRETLSYKRLGQARAAAQAAAEECRRRSASLDTLVQDQAETTTRLEATLEQLREAQGCLSQRRREAERIEALRLEVESALQAEKKARGDLDAATAAHEARAALASDVERRTARVAELEAQAETAQAERDLCERALAGSSVALADAEALKNAARTASAQARLALEKHRDRAERDQLTARAERAGELDRRSRAARAALAANPVDEAAADRLAGLATELRIAEDTRALAAATMTIRPLGPRVHLDGHPLAPGTETLATVLTDTHLEVPGLLEVEIRPGATPSEVEEKVNRARANLETALAEAGVSSVLEARESAERRARAASALEHTERELKLILAADSLEGIRERLAVLSQRLAEAEPHDGDTGLAQLESSAIQTAATAQRRETEAEEARDERERAREAAEKARSDWVRASAELGAARQEQANSVSRLAEARSRDADSGLSERVVTATRELTARRQATEEARRALKDCDPETTELLLANQTQLVQRLTGQRSDLRSEVDGLTALVSHQASEGIYDQLAEAQAELSAAEDEWERTDRAAKAARLLRDVMLDKRAEAQRKYVAPFKNRIERLGRVVFGPGFSVEVSEELEVVSRTVDGRTVPFDSLSAGAREQLALLGRLACAQLVSPGEGAPVVLDDTLGFADPARLAALNAVLNDVGQLAQVILLTCQPHRFAALGQARVVQLPARGSR